MVKLLLDLVQFLYTAAPLLVSLAVLTLLAVLLSGSIKRHAAVYYIAFAIPLALVAIPFTGRLLGIETFNVGSVPLLGSITRDYIHAGTLGFPLLIIIMYTGALDPRNPVAKKLLAIRKELSILSGFPILAHSLIRVTNNFPRALGFFTGGEASGSVTSPTGAWISNTSLVLGILMLALFIPLWVTSFDRVRRYMGNVRWKKLQRWSYVLYALLFIHAAGIQVGGMLNSREGRGTPPPAVEASVAPAAGNQGGQQQARGAERGDRSGNAPRAGAIQPARGGHQQEQGFAGITVDARARRYVHLASLLLVFGSYLYLRTRKARRDAARRAISR
jgi:DMSO/TMAO reductase YedYZ heme-binding membrane subunit